MKVTTPEISWHGREPIYSVDLQPCSSNLQRLASCGVDKFVRMWKVRVDSEGKVDVEFLSNLSRHTATVNVCRFSPDGKTLATAGDDAVILLWRLNETPTPANNIFSDEDADNKESWLVAKTLRGHLGDVYDLCWSPDSRHIVSGSVDNSVIVWDTHKDVKLALFNEHKSYVQGVAWDPLREYIATLSCDRSCRIYNLATKHCIHNICKMVSPHAAATAPEGTKPKASRLFHDDTLRSFFRRLAFSPDGQLLITPAGLMETGEKQVNATFIFTRGTFKEPAAYLPSPNKATVAVRACPCLFRLRKVSPDGPVNENGKEWEKYSTVFRLPYRVVFAVATEDSVVLYDSQQTLPFAYLSNIHYHSLSDLTWSKDGRILVVASTDGYCSVVTFEAGELGDLYTPEPIMSTDPKTSRDQQAVAGTSSISKKQSGSSNQPTTSAAEKMEVDEITKPPSEQKSPESSKENVSRGQQLSGAPAAPPPSSCDTALESDMKSVTLSSSSAPTANNTASSSPSQPETPIVTGKKAAEEKSGPQGEQASDTSSTSATPASSNSSTNPPSETPVVAEVKAAEAKAGTQAQDAPKQPKRIQLTTLSLLKPK